MRRIAAALTVPLVAVGVLAGCGSSSGSGGDANGAVSVSGKFGQPPTVTIPAQKANSSLTIKTAIHGRGQTLGTGDALLGNFAIYLWRGTTHKLLDSTFKTGPQVLPGQLSLTGLAKALQGQKMGSRVLAVLPPKYGYGTQGNTNIGIRPTDTTVWVVDLIRAFKPAASASGTAVSNGGGSLPQVTARNGTAPVIKIPAVKPPASLVTKTLIKGSGTTEAANGDTIVAQVVGMNWRTKKAFYSTWPTSASSASAPFSFQLGGSVIAGWNDGLRGVTAGSRVLLVVPPKDGYGSKGNVSAGIKGTDTLVFVVDVLDVVPPAS
ncbi:MAG: FKBP-type peptidyl-prolyl cis-trans isomerase [Streptosporangiaceae bacterium]